MPASARTLEIDHSWPLFEQGRRFDLGFAMGRDMAGLAAPAFDARDLLDAGVGAWVCDLTAGDALSWSTDVYDLFGLPRGAHVSRSEAVCLYAERSRAAMERLRAHAIRHCRGFTLDAEIIPASGAALRWMRLIAAPVCVGGRVVRLQGVKRDITCEYR